MTCTGNPATTAPLTMFAWHKGNTNTSLQTVIHIGAVGKATQKHFQLRYQYHVTNFDTFSLQEYSSAGSNETISWSVGGVPEANAWLFVCGVIEGAASRKLYVNGTQRATGTTSIGLSVPLATTRIARGARGRTGAYLDAELGPCGIIPYAFTAEQIGLLANGVDPQDYPDAYSGAVWQMLGGESPVPNVVGDDTYELTVNTAPTAVDSNPPLTGSLQFPGTQVMV
jgi:hypothetical protein